MIGRRLAAPAALALLAMVGSAAEARGAPRIVTVTIADMAFGPPPADLRAGDTIEWVNKDAFQHTATARDRSFDVDLPPGAHARVRLRKAGVIGFYCRYHPGMSGKLTVGK